MKIKYTAYAFLLLFFSCKNDSNTATVHTRDYITISNEFVDAFYSFNSDSRIRSVTTSSNDPEEYYEAKQWVKENRPAYIEKHYFLPLSI